MYSHLKNIYICFPEGRFKVLTMSYDDGMEQDRRLVEIFNHHGIRGTFHLNGGLIKGRVPKEEWSTLYAGHEISCHTVFHPTIERSPIEQVALQLLEDRRELEQYAGYPVRGMSYPNGSHTKQIRDMLPYMGIEYGRIVGNSGDFSLPEDLYAWKPTCHHNHRLLELGRDFLSFNKPQYLIMLYVWGHSYEFDADGNWERMEEFCRMMAGDKDIWYATNIEYVDYMKAARALHFTVEGDKVFNPGASTVWITVNDVLFALPGGRLTELK